MTLTKYNRRGVIPLGGSDHLVKFMWELTSSTGESQVQLEERPTSKVPSWNMSERLVPRIC